jgi:phosphatidylserine decarboxylase
VTSVASERTLDALIRALWDDAPPLGALRAGAPLIAFPALLAPVAARRSPALGAALAGLALYIGWFFRDPPRRCPGRPDTVYAAADGTILAVEQVASDWYIRGPVLRVATFLSPLDVHVNRSPVAGRLVAARRVPGRRLPAFLASAGGENARQLLGIERPAKRPSDASVPRPPRTSPDAAARRVVVVQIAGFLARRIVTWRVPGDHLSAGQKLGLIRFGSQTDVLLPAGVADPLVTPGARVYAGLTPLARFREP